MMLVWMLMAVLTVGILSCSTAAKTSSGGGVVTEKIPQLSPEQARLYDQFFLEAMVQRQKGQQDAAFDLLSHCLDINPHAAEVYFFMAQYYSALKQAEKSLDYFQTAARLNPQNETYMETLAQVYIRQQNYQDAIAVIEKLYERHKDRENLLEMLFQLYQEVDDFQNAIAVLERIEMIDGKSERLSMAKSEVYTRMGNEEAAVEEMAALAKQYPNDLNYLAMYGESLMMNGETKQALEIYNRILKEEPNNNRVLMSLRTYYLSLEDYEMADSLTRRVLLGRSTSLEEKTYLIRQIIGTNEQAGGDSTEVLRMFHQMM
jgi:tetratricopeptide (TPR) repeat protein